jgi:HEAT repeat protein
MRWKLPGPRLRLRTLTMAVALLALTLWAGLSIWSPTRRLGQQLRADQPVYVRREAAASLGRAIPPWEIDEAMSLLMGALKDPSPRVRESATVGLVELGPRARPAVPKLIGSLGDEDRNVRFAAVRALGTIGADPAKRGEVMAALNKVLDDSDPELRLVAGEALVKIGKSQEGAAALVSALCGSNLYRRSWARSMIRQANDARFFLPALVKEMRCDDANRRDEALQMMLHIASPDEVKGALSAAAISDDVEIRQWAAGKLERIDSGR